MQNHFAGFVSLGAGIPEDTWRRVRLRCNRKRSSFSVFEYCGAVGMWFGDDDEFAVGCEDDFVLARFI